MSSSHGESGCLLESAELVSKLIFDKLTRILEKTSYSYTTLHCLPMYALKAKIQIKIQK